MIINLYANKSDNNVINKTIIQKDSIEVKLKDSTSVINPRLILKGNINAEINYLYIPSWKRYYYIIDKISLANDIYELNCKCDVLMSHKSKILNSDALVYASENLKNSYIASDIYVNDVRENTRVINFPDGFNNVPEFVLITAGANII